MRKIKNCLFALIGVTVLSAGLASCNGGQDVTSETPITSQTDTSSVTSASTVPVNYITIAETKTKSVKTTYAALTSADTGNLYTFTATFVDTQPKTGAAVSCNFTLGSTEIVLRTDKYDTVGISTTFVAGSQYKFTISLSWYRCNN